MKLAMVLAVSCTAVGTSMQAGGHTDAVRDMLLAAEYLEVSTRQLNAALTPSGTHLGRIAGDQFYCHYGPNLDEAIEILVTTQLDLIGHPAHFPIFKAAFEEGFENTVKTPNKDCSSNKIKVENTGAAYSIALGSFGTNLFFEVLDWNAANNWFYEARSVAAVAVALNN